MDEIVLENTQGVSQNFTLEKKIEGKTVSVLLAHSNAADANYYSVVHVNDAPMSIIRVRAAWTAASSSGTLQIERLQGTEAPGSGDSILASTIDTSGSANTVVTREGSVDLSNTVLNPGDRIALVDSGTLTGLANLTVTIYMVPLNDKKYRIYA